jgi:hypothetical protein
MERSTAWPAPPHPPSDLYIPDTSHFSPVLPVVICFPFVRGQISPLTPELQYAWIKPCYKTQLPLLTNLGIPMPLFS